MFVNAATAGPTKSARTQVESCLSVGGKHLRTEEDQLIFSFEHCIHGTNWTQ